MTATVTLPAVLHSRLTSLRRRIRLLGLSRGCARSIVVLVLSAAALVGLDSWLDLPSTVRQMLFWMWLGESAILSLISVGLPLCRRIDVRDIAAAIEAKYPDLGERLTSAVELAEGSEPGHGSPLLIGLLLEEAAQRSQTLDFQPAIPRRRAAMAGGLAGIVLATGVAAALVWPKRVDERIQRFTHPQNPESVVASYDIAVSPGDAVAARGQTLSLSARVTPSHEGNAPFEATAFLVIEAEGTQTRLAMTPANEGTFAFAHQVTGDFSYRIEAGSESSPAYRVTAVAPVELAADSPRVVVVPPEYARSVVDEEKFTGLVDLSPLQHSTVRFDFHFTRPAVSGAIEWISEARGDDANAATKNERQSLLLSEDRRSASLTFAATKDVKYRLILEAEHGVRTELAGGTIRVVPDRPPSVVRFGGKEELRSVLPSDRIPLEIEAADDFGVTQIELEYRVNDRESKRESLKLESGVTQSALARSVLELTGKLREGDRLDYRFHLRDNLPKEYGGPHAVVYPSDRWLTLQAAKRGDPLKQQEILAQRDEINRRLQAVRESMLRERRGVYKVRQETRDAETLATEQVEVVDALQRDNRGAEKALHEIAEIAEASPPLRPVAETATQVAEGEMRQSGEALAQAPRQKTPVERTRRFDKADEQLEAALKRLDEAKATNDRLAQERLDRIKLETLAERESHLAERAAELAEQPLDPKGSEAFEKLRREQAETAAELERLSQQSEPLKQALERARQENAEQLAERARRLARDQRDLSRAESETERRQRIEKLADLARKQQDLAEQQEALARRSREALKVAQASPLQPEEYRKAVEELQRDRAKDALQHQEQAANDLERMAQAFERALAAASDPKEAARQLAQAEHELRQRAHRASGDKKPLIDEQNAIRRTAERLSIPPDDAEANAVKRSIAERATQAEQALGKRDASEAEARMEETKKLLQRLSDILPPLDKRRKAALQELERQRREQEQIARRVERLPKEGAAARQQSEQAARAQAEVVKKLSAMDAPMQENRRQRAEEALRRALADLNEGRREDVESSQREAQRQLEWLERALRGEKPADEQARDLARRQHELAEAAKHAEEGANPAQRKEEIKRNQQKIAEETASLPGDAPQRQREAVEAAQTAATAVRTNPTSPESQKRMEEASRKLDELARQLAGEESDAAKAERLARAQADAVAENERQPDRAASEERQRRQREIAREASEIRGGEAASQEKKRALEAFQNLERASPRDRGQASRQAADALRDFADRLSGRNEAADKANHLASQQRALADEVAADRTDKNAAERQAELARQLRRLDGRKALPQMVETRARMGDAVVALTRAKNPSDAKRAVARAADSADRLAEKLAATRKRPVSPVEAPQPGSPRSIVSPLDPPTPSGLPSAELRDLARRLAQQQRALSDRVKRLNQSTNDERPSLLDNPVEDLVRRQAAVAKEAEELARDVADEQGDKAAVARQAGQARETTAEAARQLVAGSLPTALRAGEQSADRLRQLASQLVSLPRGVENPTKDVLLQARRLSQRQQEINRLLQPLANDARAQAGRQRARQRELERETSDLMRQFQDSAQKPGASEAMKSAMQQAGGDSDRARRDMRQANERTRSGDSSSAKESQDSAAAALDRAAQTAASAARASSGKSAKASPKAGEAMTQAAGQMADAQGQLSQGKPGRAQAAMKQAAQSLAQAAGQMAAGEPSQPGRPSPSAQSSGEGAQPGGLPNLSAYGLDSTAYAGKSWGELPGELRTKIVQDIRANYGDDYARTIKYYFEHLADTRKK